MKKLSVITVTYNSVDVIERTIQSVFAQSNDFFEYIVIDGGSNDGTKEILALYEHRFDYFISEADSGV